MPRFDDYHRTVVGYHGTGLTSALRIINRVENFNWSQKDYDWLGGGIYFWGYAPRQALRWAMIRQREFVSDVFEKYKENIELAGDELPSNDRHYRKLDRAVFDYSYAILENSDDSSRVDTARGIYVPSGGKKRVWDGSWISRDTHIQLCVRNLASILGTWLHYPAGLGVNDVCEALQAGVAVVEPADPQGEEDAPGDVETGTD